MTALITYSVHIDTARTGLFAAPIDDVTSYVTSARFMHGMQNAYEEVSPPAMGGFELINHDGRFDVENPSALYYDKLLRGTLVRVRATHNGVTTQLYVGRIRQVMPTLGEGRAKRVSLICECPMNALLQAEYKPALQESVTADVAIAPIFDTAVITYPYAGTFWLLGIAGHSELGTTTTLYDHDVTDFDTGVTIFEFVGDNLGGEGGLAAQTFIRDYVAAEMGGRFFFDARDGKFKFHNRHRDILNMTVAAVMARQEAERVEPVYADDVFNKVTIHYRPRDIGAVGSVLWSQANVPFALAEGVTRKFTGRYRDPDNPSARVGGMDFIEPLPGLDLIVNVREDASGSDQTHRVNMSVIFGASSADISVTNSWDRTLYVQTLQVRGTPLTIYDKQYVTAVNGESIGMNGLIEETRQLNALADAELAQSYANMLVERFGTPVTRVGRLTFDANKSPDFAAKALFRSIGDQIQLIDNPTRNYTLIGEEHEIMGGANPDVPATHLATWVLQPRNDRYNYWLLGVQGFSELGTTTRLAL